MTTDCVFAEAGWFHFYWHLYWRRRRVSVLPHDSLPLLDNVVSCQYTFEMLVNCAITITLLLSQSFEGLKQWRHQERKRKNNLLTCEVKQQKHLHRLIVTAANNIPSKHSYFCCLLLRDQCFLEKLTKLLWWGKSLCHIDTLGNATRAFMPPFFLLSYFQGSFAVRLFKRRVFGIRKTLVTEEHFLSFSLSAPPLEKKKTTYFPLRRQSLAALCFLSLCSSQMVTTCKTNFNVLAGSLSLV